jgi:alpha-L-arabinofuranosidase
LVNIDPTKKITVNTAFSNGNFTASEAQVLTSGKFTDINTFDQPSKVKLATFSDYKKNGSQLSVNMPPMSVVLITMK